MPLARRYNQTERKVIILSETTDEPVTLAGMLCGVCQNADTKDNSKNFKRGLECIKSGHDRVLEFPQIYMILDGWSARVIREFYTHIGGAPTRLQASTRYIDYSNFDYVVPKSVENNDAAYDAYVGCMENISNTATYLENITDIKREDSGMVLPLAMQTKVIVRTNLRNLIDMAKVRMCSRAYWEYRELFNNIIESLSIYSDEWEYLIESVNIFKPKCEWYGYCNETNGCGRKISKYSNTYKWLDDFKNSCTEEINSLQDFETAAQKFIKNNIEKY